MADAVKQRQNERSPKYPSFGLQEAINKVQQFWDKDQGAAAPKNALAKHWDYSPKSSGFLQAIATLKQYGLLDTTGEGLLRPSKLAGSIVMLEQDDPAHRAAVQKAAQRPPIFVDLRKEWPGRLPSDATMQHHLVDVRSFRPNAARVLVASFKNTVDLFGGTGYDSGEHNNPDGGGTRVKVGDFVQWTSQDQQRFAEPRRVSGLSEDGEWAFVEGTETGLPAKELEVAEAPVDAVTAPRNPHYKAADTDDAIYGDAWSSKNGIRLRFPFGIGNELVIIMRKQVSKKEFDSTVKAVYGLSSASFVDNRLHDDVSDGASDNNTSDQS